MTKEQFEFLNRNGVMQMLKDFGISTSNITDGCADYIIKKYTEGAFNNTSSVYKSEWKSSCEFM